ncbi:MAG: hypothetical protein ABSG56_16630 [Bryobacteraceae bacterium]
MYFTLQNMSEFWNVATRPTANNGLGFSVVVVSAALEVGRPRKTMACPTACFLGTAPALA